MEYISNKYKYGINLNMIGDMKNQQSHFQDMAQKGWMIEKFGLYLLRYRQIEPQNLTFIVDVVPTIGLFDYPNNYDAIEFRKKYQAEGFTFQAAQKGINVFYTHDTSTPLPAIYKDNTQECKWQLSAFTKTDLVSSIISLFMLVFFISAFFVFGSIEFLLSNIITFLVLGISIPTVAAILDVTLRFTWYIKTKIASRNNKPPSTISPKITALLKVLMFFGITLLIICAVAGIILEILGGMNPVILILMLTVLLIAILNGIFIRHRINKKDSARGDNVAMWIFISIGSVIIMLILSTTMISISSPRYMTELNFVNKPAIMLSDLAVPYENSIFIWDDSTSIFVPVNYRFEDRSRDYFVSTQVRTTISPFITKMFYEHAVKEVHRWISRFEIPRSREVSYTVLNSGDGAIWHGEQDLLYTYRDAGFWWAQEGTIFEFAQGDVTLVLLRDDTVIVIRLLGMEIDYNILSEAVHQLWLDLQRVLL